MRYRTLALVLGFVTLIAWTSARTQKTDAQSDNRIAVQPDRDGRSVRSRPRRLRAAHKRAAVALVSLRWTPPAKSTEHFSLKPSERLGQLGRR